MENAAQKKWKCELKISNKIFGNAPSADAFTQTIADFEERNGLIVDSWVSHDTNRATVYFRLDPAAPKPALWPAVILVVTFGTIFIGAMVWTWEVITESLVEVTESATELVETPVVKIVTAAVIGAVAVELFRKWNWI